MQVNQREIDRKAYELACQHLLGIKGVTADVLAKYLNPPCKPTSKSGLYERLVHCAQDRDQRANVIGRAINGGIPALSGVLNKFEPSDILNKYGDDWAELLDAIVRDVQPRGQVRRTPRGVWPQFCKSILSGARFLAQFETLHDFYKWADFFDQDKRARPGLPMLIDHEIYGFGFTLGCNFMKEIGYVSFGKPDTQMR